MSNVTLLAIDLAKNTFQLHGTDAAGKAVLKKKISRVKLAEFIANLPNCRIYMEACATSNYWGRKFIEFGHQVKLIHPRYVKPYVKRNKNDMNDAAGIAAAARDPDMRFCTVKTEAQQDVQSIHRIRSLLIQQRTALANNIRGLLSEYGIAIAQGITKVRSCIPDILGNNPNNMSKEILDILREIYEHFKAIDQKILACDQKIKALFKSNETCKRLAEIPGIGELSATILASTLGNGAAFKNGRHFAAFLGLVPKQHSSGNKELLLGISKRGDIYIRTLLIHGARAVLRWVDKKTDPHSKWFNVLIARRGKNVAAVAFANKIARVAWAIVMGNTRYKANYKSTVPLNRHHRLNHNNCTAQSSGALSVTA